MAIPAGPPPITAMRKGAEGDGIESVLREERLFWQSHTAAAAASNEEEAFGAEFGLRLIGGDHWAPFGQTIGGGGGLNRMFFDEYQKCLLFWGQ